MTDQTSVTQLVAEMTVAEKIGQMTQVSNESISPAEVADNAIGSILSGGNGLPHPNTPAAWLGMVESFLDAGGSGRLGIPLIYGVDAVHGHAGVRGATVFPHNIGLGASGDADLVRHIGGVTATEMRATGIRWTFAPTVAVPQDIRWGRTYEGYGRDPGLVSRLGAALVEGLQGADVGTLSTLACAKHYLGDGATSWGTAPRLDFVHWWDGWGEAWQIDQGDARISEEEMRSVHLPPYRAAVDAGVMTVMASYNSWNGAKLHAHSYLLTDVLKGELGFRGFVVTDWMGIDQIDADYDLCVERAINAGVDMVMVPDDWHRYLDAMGRLTASGKIPLTRIDDAVGRILAAKLSLDTEIERPPLSVIGSDEHRRLAADAVRRSAVLLKNEGGLPLRPGAGSIAVAGRAANDVGLQCGGWTAGWQGGIGATTPGSTLLDGIRATAGRPVEYAADGRFADDLHAGIGVMCVAEPPYAEGPGDRAVPGVDAEDREVFARLRARVERLVLVVYSGRPLVIPDLIDQSDAVVAAWLPGSEGAALADLLAGHHRYEATTPQPWPRDRDGLEKPAHANWFEVGHGLDLDATPEPDGLEPS